MTKKIALATLLASTLTLCAQAADTKTDTKVKNPLVTHTELGYIQTTGNTETRTFNLDTKWEKTWDKHVFTWTFDGQYAEDDDIESKNKFYTELEYDYKFTERFAFNYLAGYKKDKFSAFDDQFYTGPGAKYKAIMTKVHNLSLEGNILYSSDTYIQTDEVNDYAALRLKGVYDWKIDKTFKFGQELTYRADFSDMQNYFVYSKTDLTAKMTDIFSAGISYKVDYVNLPGDKKSTDTTFTVGLIVDY